MKRKLIKALGLSLIMTTVLSGCNVTVKSDDGSKSDNVKVELNKDGVNIDVEENSETEVTEDTEETTESTDVVEEVVDEVIEEVTEDIDVSELNKSEKLAYDFMKKIQDMDYEGALSYIYQDMTYFTATDLQNYLYQTTFSEFLDTEFVISEVSSDRDNSENTVYFKINGDYECALRTKMNDDNKWTVIFNEVAFADDVSLTTPTGVSVKVNGVDVPETRISNVNKYYTTYHFDTLPTRKLDITLSSEIFGEYVIPDVEFKDGKSRQVDFHLNQEDETKYLEAVSTLIREIDDLYKVDKEKESFRKYVTNDETLDLLMDSLAILEKDTWEGEEHRFSVIDYDYDNDDCYAKIHQNDEVYLVLNYEKIFTEIANGDLRSAKHTSPIIIKLTEEGCKIVSLEDSNNIFTENGHITGDW